MSRTSSVHEQWMLCACFSSLASFCSFQTFGMANCYVECDDVLGIAFLIALRDIHENEEVLYSYGLDSTYGLLVVFVSS